MSTTKEHLNKVIVCNQSVGIVRYIGPISEESGILIETKFTLN